MTTQDIQNLSEDQLKELMYNLSRSGRVIIPQYYRGEHIKNLTGSEPTEEIMLQVQENFEYDWDLHEILEEKIQLFSLQD